MLSHIVWVGSNIILGPLEADTRVDLDVHRIFIRCHIYGRQKGKESRVFRDGLQTMLQL